MSETFEYKPAPLAPTNLVEVGEYTLALTKSGKRTELPWNAMKSVRYWSMSLPSHGMEFLGLDFENMSGKPIQLRINIPMKAPADDGYRVGFRQMLRACLRQATVQNPGIQIIVGQKKNLLWAMFGIGLVCVLFSLGLPLSAWIMEENGVLERALVPILVMLAFGAGVMWMFNPFTPPIILSAERVQEMLGDPEPEAPAS